MYAIQSIYEAVDVSDAVKALEANPGAMVISGGTDVLIQLREGKHDGVDLVSIHKIEALKGIRRSADGVIRIGAGTVFSRISADAVIRASLPALAFAADQVGGPQIRNVGTIGGNVCNGVTSADTAAILCALNARLVLEGPAGVRRVWITDFYKGVKKTDCDHAEIVTHIEITPENYEGYTGTYIKYAKRNAMDIAILGCGVQVKLDASKSRLEDMRISFGVAAPVPVRCKKTEAALRGMTLDAALIEMLNERILSDVTPRDSWRASKDFRIHLIKVLSQRALVESIEKGGGVIHA